ncbi:MAG: hypothetical protein ACRDG4_08350 [Chloroflexota bacterium]
MAPSDTLRTLLHRLFTDSEYRRAFVVSPEALFQGLSLGSEERRALHRLQRRLAGTAGTLEDQASTLFWP